MTQELALPDMTRLRVEAGATNVAVPTTRTGLTQAEEPKEADFRTLNNPAFTSGRRNADEQRLNEVVARANQEVRANQQRVVQLLAELNSNPPAEIMPPDSAQLQQLAAERTELAAQLQAVIDKHQTTKFQGELIKTILSLAKAGVEGDQNTAERRLMVHNALVRAFRNVLPVLSSTEAREYASINQLNQSGYRRDYNLDLVTQLTNLKNFLTQLSR